MSDQVSYILFSCYWLRCQIFSLFVVCDSVPLITHYTETKWFQSFLANRVRMNNFLILFFFGYCTFCRSLGDSVLLCNRNEGRRKVRSVPTTCWPVGMERKETRLLPQLAAMVVVHGVAFWCGRWNTFSPTPPEKTMTKRRKRKKKNFFPSFLPSARARSIPMPLVERK